MTSVPRVFVAASAMVTAVGQSAATTAAAVTAGVSRFEDSDMLNKRLRPIRMALVREEALPQAPELSSMMMPSRQERMLRLAVAALNDLAQQGVSIESLPLFLALPENLPGKTTPWQGNFIQLLSALSGSEFAAASRAVSLGRAGGLHAIDLAHKYFAASDGDFVLVGGVDTYLDPGLLARLDAEDRLSLEGAADGFIPGEGAAFLLLARESAKSRLHSPLMTVSVPGFGNEAGHYYGSAPYLGNGLAAAVSQALDNGGTTQVSELWTSINGEQFWQKELGVAMSRNSAAMSAGTRIEHPADCIGDLGAACAFAMLGLLHQGSRLKSARKSALICCSSDLEPRAAIAADLG